MQEGPQQPAGLPGQGEAGEVWTVHRAAPTPSERLRHVTDGPVRHRAPSDKSYRSRRLRHNCLAFLSQASLRGARRQSGHSRAMLDILMDSSLCREKATSDQIQLLAPCVTHSKKCPGLRWVFRGLA